MSYAQTVVDPVIDEAPGLIRGHRRSGLSGAAQKALSDPSATVAPEDIASVRESFRDMFGGATAEQALRQIDRRVDGGQEITGEHVQTAAVAAMELLSPLIRAGRAVKDAETVATHAAKQLTAAQQKLEDAKREKEEDDSRYVPGQFSPGVNSDRERSMAAFKKAEEEHAAAQKDNDKADKRLGEANRNLDVARKSADASFAPGEDEVNLLHKRDGLEKAVVAAGDRNETALREVETAKAELAERSKDRDSARERDGYGGDALNPGVQEPYKAAVLKLEQAEARARETEQDIQDALDDMRALDQQFSALTGGPGLRQAQMLLDNLGGDPRLQKEMAATAPSSYLEKGKALVKSNVAPKELGKTVVGLVPLVSTFTKYAEMVDHEDTQRRLDGATQRLGATPMAASMSQVLSRDAEISKDKAGMQMAIGFVASGISMTIPIGIGQFGGSALGALMSPMTTAITTGVQQGTATALGATASGLLGSAVSGGTSWAIKKVATTALTKGGEQIAPDQLDADRRKLADQLSQAKDFEVPEGTAMPAIPKPDGSGEAWNLSDPNVAKALLAYLGPGPDKKMLADPAQRDTEERRLMLREQTFGTPRSVDLAPGKAATELDKQLIETLDKGSRGGGGGVPSASPLQTLYAALGWMKT